LLKDQGREHRVPLRKAESKNGLPWKSGLADKAANSVLQRIHVEVDEKAHRYAAKAEIGQQLRLVDGKQPVDCLEFDQDFVVDQDVTLALDV
jgi:hypothetical protein